MRNTYHYFKTYLCFIAPGAYDVDKAEKVMHQSSGAVTFGIKYKDPKPDDIPGSSLFSI